MIHRHIDPRLAYEHPVNEEALRSAVQDIRQSAGVDMSSAADWLLECRTAHQLRERIRGAWKSHGALTPLAPGIDDARTFIDAQGGLIGVLVRLNRGDVFLQEVPRTPDWLAQNASHCPDSLLALYQAAPGLTFRDDTFLASSQFLLEPLRQWTFSPDGRATVHDARQADSPVPEYGYEFAFKNSVSAVQAVLLDNNGVAYLYEDHEAALGAIELSLNVDSLIQLFVDKQRFPALRPFAVDGGRTISIRRAGDAARAAFAELGRLDQALVSLAVFWHAVASSDNDVCWKRVRLFAERLERVVIGDHPLTRTQVAAADEEFCGFRGMNPDYEGLLSVPLLVAVYWVSGNPLPYPDCVQLRPGATALPVFECVRQSISQLRVLKRRHSEADYAIEFLNEARANDRSRADDA